VHLAHCLNRHGRLRTASTGTDGCALPQPARTVYDPLYTPLFLGDVDAGALALRDESPFHFGDHSQDRDEDPTGVGRGADFGFEDT